MDVTDWIVTVLLSLTAGFCTVTWLVPARRSRAMARQLALAPPVPERPVVFLVVDDIRYDLTDSGVRDAEPNAKGMTVWRYTAPGRLVTEQTRSADLLIAACPPRTVVGFTLSDEFN